MASQNEQNLVGKPRLEPVRLGHRPVQTVNNHRLRQGRTEKAPLAVAGALSRPSDIFRGRQRRRLSPWSIHYQVLVSRTDRLNISLQHAVDRYNARSHILTSLRQILCFVLMERVSSGSKGSFLYVQRQKFYQGVDFSTVQRCVAVVVRAPSWTSNVRLTGVQRFLQLTHSQKDEHSASTSHILRPFEASWEQENVCQDWVDLLARHYCASTEERP